MTEKDSSKSEAVVGENREGASLRSANQQQELEPAQPVEYARTNLTIAARGIRLSVSQLQDRPNRKNQDATIEQMLLGMAGMIDNVLVRLND